MLFHKAFYKTEMPQVIALRHMTFNNSQFKLFMGFMSPILSIIKKYQGDRFLH